MNIKSLRPSIILTLAVSAVLMTGLTAGNLIAASDSGGPSEADVKAAFYKAFAHRDADETTVTFDSAIKIGAPVSGQKAPYLGKQAFPVKADFTVDWIYKSGDARTERNHKKGGIYLFYRDSAGGWSFDIETQPTMSSERKK
jgi:hypothetical protein